MDLLGLCRTDGSMGVEMEKIQSRIFERVLYLCLFLLFAYIYTYLLFLYIFISLFLSFFLSVCLSFYRYVNCFLRGFLSSIRLYDMPESPWRLKKDTEMPLVFKRGSLLFFWLPSSRTRKKHQKNHSKGRTYCWWFRNPAPVEVGRLSHYLQGFSTIQKVVGTGISEPSTVSPQIN